MSSRLLAVALATSALLLTAAPQAPRAQTPTAPSTSSQPEDPDPGDLSWHKQIEAKLVAEQFDDLDRIADHLRRDKVRILGGGWKLRTFYEALDAPQLTDADSVAHIAHLEHWMATRPESITARIALATSLDRWAWVARGNGLASTVTPDGWRLFRERSGRAATILADAANLRTMDPQYFAELMTVGRAQEWDASRVHDAFARGIQFEPDYIYLYKEYASYLLPKWFGQPGQSATFAKDSADHLGGDAGDALYFQIATVLIKRGDGDFPVQQLDWNRIQGGYTAVGTQFGYTSRMRNELAYMAWKYKDVTTARQQFVAIGPRWSRSVWREKAFFDRIRDWSNGHNT